MIKTLIRERRGEGKLRRTGERINGGGEWGEREKKGERGCVGEERSFGDGERGSNGERGRGNG